MWIAVRFSGLRWGGVRRALLCSGLFAECVGGGVDAVSEQGDRGEVLGGVDVCVDQHEGVDVGVVVGV